MFAALLEQLRRGEDLTDAQAAEAMGLIMDGQAQPAFKASGDITSMSQADGYIEVAVGVGSVDKGDMVEVTLF